MVEYNKYLTEGKNNAASMAEAAIERMEDLLADFEMFLDEHFQKNATGPNDRFALGLKAEFYRMFDKQWDSMKKDLIIFSRKLDKLK